MLTFRQFINEGPLATSPIKLQASLAKSVFGGSSAQRPAPVMGSNLNTGAAPTPSVHSPLPDKQPTQQSIPQPQTNQQPISKPQQDLGLTSMHPKQRAFIRSIGATESGFSRKEAYTDANNKASNNANVRKYGWKGADYGYYQTNQSDVNDAVKRGVNPEVARHLHGGGKGGKSLVTQQTRAMHEYLGKKYPKQYDALKSDDPGAFEAARKKMQGQWFGLKDNPSLARKQYANKDLDWLSGRSSKTQVAQAKQPKTGYPGGPPGTRLASVSKPKSTTVASLVKTKVKPT